MAIVYGRHNTPHLLCDTEALQTIGPRRRSYSPIAWGQWGPSDSDDASCDRNAYHVVSFASGEKPRYIFNRTRLSDPLNPKLYKNGFLSLRLILANFRNSRRTTAAVSAAVACPPVKTNAPARARVNALFSSWR